MTDDLRYPIGKARTEAHLTDERRGELIGHIEAAPNCLRAAVMGLSDEQLDTPYRPGGWTVRQLVHHVPDSHLNAYTRFKLGLTEDRPAIKTYDEARWAELPDSRMPIEVSLTLLATLHQRWVELLRALPDSDWEGKLIRHPDWGEINLNQLLSLYAWHSRHHVAHVTALRERMGW